MTQRIYVAVPDGWDGPLVGRDDKSGDLFLEQGFLEAVADASGLSLPWHGDQSKPRLTEDIIARLLIRWYVERRKAGAPADPAIDDLAREELGYLPTFHQDQEANT